MTEHEQQEHIASGRMLDNIEKIWDKLNNHYDTLMCTSNETNVAVARIEANVKNIETKVDDVSRVVKNGAQSHESRLSEVEANMRGILSAKKVVYTAFVSSVFALLTTLVIGYFTLERGNKVNDLESIIRAYETVHDKLGTTGKANK